MATITVRGLDDRVKASLEERARSNGQSMEAEVRTLLESSVEEAPSSRGLGSRIRELFADAGGIDFIPVDGLRDEKPKAANFDR